MNPTTYPNNPNSFYADFYKNQYPETTDCGKLQQQITSLDADLVELKRLAGRLSFPLDVRDRVLFQVLIPFIKAKKAAFKLNVCDLAPAPTTPAAAADSLISVTPPAGASVPQSVAALEMAKKAANKKTLLIAGVVLVILSGVGLWAYKSRQ